MPRSPARAVPSSKPSALSQQCTRLKAGMLTGDLTVRCPPTLLRGPHL
jgi:hypothetical protein